MKNQNVYKLGELPYLCGVVGCSNKSWNTEFRYFRIPSEKDTRGLVVKEKQERRSRWIQSLHRIDLTESKIKNMRICSAHFSKGKPAEDGDITNPDYIPHLNMGYETRESSVSDARYSRLTARNQNLQKAGRTLQKVTKTKGTGLSTNSIETDRNESLGARNIDLRTLADEPNPVVTVPNESLVARNIDLRTLADEPNPVVTVPNEGLVAGSINLETADEPNPEETVSCEGLLLEEVSAKELLKQLTYTEAAFEGNDKKTKFYTGLPTFVALMKVFELVESEISSIRTMSKFQQFILTMMHLRLNLMFTDLAYRFNISNQTASRIFYKCLNVMYRCLKIFIIWPEREELVQTMPDSFKKHFGNQVTVIIDCFEVKIEKSSNLHAQAATWSNYKHHNTIKILIGISPQGAITFISNAFGGRTSDKIITERCGILENLLPGDLVMADRGFLIHESVELRMAKVVTPAFLKGRKQLSPFEIESTRKLANVRIHVERVIGLVRRKYKILSDLLPLTTIKKKTELNTQAIDEILTVTCALTNLCPSIVI